MKPSTSGIFPTTHRAGVTQTKSDLGSYDHSQLHCGEH